jgi:hypothetical protein
MIINEQDISKYDLFTRNAINKSKIVTFILSLFFADKYVRIFSD